MNAAAPARRLRVVVVGAGFGGLAAVRGLRDAPVDIALIDRENFHTFQPLLYQVATAGLDAEQVAHAVRGIVRRQRNVTVRLGEVTGIDWHAHTVVVDGAATISFDRLVLAAGAVTATFGVPGVEEHAFGLKSVDEAMRLRAHLLRRFEAAAADAAVASDGALSAVVVGGGATGVELAGALVELRDHVLAKDFPGLDVGLARIVLVEQMDHLLSAFHRTSQRNALTTLRGRGVDVRLNVGVSHVTPTRVHLTDGTVIGAHTTVWAAGVRAAPLADNVGLKQDRGGRIVVRPDLSVPGHPGVYAVGDLAGSRDRTRELHPQVAQNAIQGGKHVAKQMVRELEGLPPTPFRYRNKGIMATIGRNAAVTELPGGIRFHGPIAWLAWLSLHLLYLIGFRNRLAVLLDWAWSYVSYDRAARLILGRSDRTDRTQLGS